MCGVTERTATLGSLYIKLRLNVMPFTKVRAMKLPKSIQKIALATFTAATLAFVPAASYAAIGVSIGISVGTPPPVLPVYTQPICPAPGYLWTPGYWAYGPAGYYWVPGVWVQPPSVGVLWTPPYWGWSGGAYLFHAGYWGPHIGFYGGVNYGFGYTGIGYEGGYWRNGAFAYNRAVNNIDVVHVTNVYNKTVIVNNHSRVSFNGGAGGIRAVASAREQAAFNERHLNATSNQVAHEQAMRADRSQLASFNGGRPRTVAMSSVNARAANQQQRISNGVRNGQLTNGEAARAENRQGQINRQVQQDRQANGGHLTQQEHQQVNREQNHASQQIERESHNDRERR
jgi:YXWGXW repeat-containing protein